MPARNWLATLSLPEFVADRDECAVEMILDRQHVAREIGRGIARRLLQLRFQAAADVLRLRGRIERLAFASSSCRSSSAKRSCSASSGASSGGFVADLFRFVVNLPSSVMPSISSGLSL